MVIVENQFAKTDHDHLGKLLTYCAVTKAQVVVWIAESLNDEHLAALEWLNENTLSEVAFFGVEVELLRIGESLPAPHFNVVVRPNEVKKEQERATRKQIEWNWDGYAEKLNLPPARLAIGRTLVSEVESAIAERELPWQVVFRKGYVPFQTAGGYNVILVDLWARKDAVFAVKLPAPPEDLGLTNPYPASAVVSPTAQDHACGDWTVLAVAERVVPFRVAWKRGAAAVLELAAGEARRLEIAPGSRIAWGKRSIALAM